jgi:HEAT repeat protein
MTERPGDPGVHAGMAPGGSVGAPRPDPEEVAAMRLREALAATDPRVRAEAVARTTPQPGVASVLEGALEDPEPVVRLAAVRALARVEGDRSSAALIRAAAADPSPDVRLEAVAAIGRLLERRLHAAEGEPAPP